MADVVFITGAGASVHAGAPVMSTFLDRARDLLAAKEVEDRRREFETAFDVISHLQRVHSKARLDHNNIESVFSAVDLARTLNKLPGIEPDDIDDARKSLVWLIVRTLEQSIKFRSRGGVYAGTDEYRRLASLITALKEREPALTTAVLTFNYDIAADLSFAAEGLHFDYGLSPGNANMPLLKLHGSLNWARTLEESPKIVAYEMRQYIRDYQLRHRMSGDGDPMIVSPITKHAAEQFIKQGLKVEDEPVLVPPTWSKGEYHRGIANVWRRAASELEQARFIFVLGYSLPETDQFFRLLFALGTEGRSVLSRVVVFDPDPGPVKERFEKMLGHAALDRFDAQPVDFGSGLKVIDEILFATGKRRK